MRILIAVPNNRETLPVYFIKSLFGLYGETKKEHDTEILMYGTTYVGPMRNYLCDYAIKNNFDYIFMLDTDEIYPKETIVKLLQHQKEIVGGFYQRRKAPFDSVQFNDKYEFNPESGRNTIINDGTLQKVKAMGMGGVLMKVETLKSLPEPLFKEDVIDNQRYMGEDVWFSKVCFENNVEMWCDTSLVFPHETQTFIADSKIIQINE